VKTQFILKNALTSLIAAALLLSAPSLALATIESATSFRIDLTQAKEAAAKAKWSEPDRIAVTSDGLGWGAGKEEGSRDFWLQTTAPMAIGLSWRPPIYASLRATVHHPGTVGQLYARYGADGKHWTTWQLLDEVAPAKKDTADHEFSGVLRVPYREMAHYQELRMKYARREDVPWSSDEEALVQELVRGEPKFFDESAPFIGYIQFLYEAQLHSGQRITGLEANASWSLGGMHQRPKDENTSKDRDVPWRFKAP
jgi:hypothetical protein